MGIPLQTLKYEAASPLVQALFVTLLSLSGGSPVPQRRPNRPVAVVGRPVGRPGGRPNSLLDGGRNEEDVADGTEMDGGEGTTLNPLEEEEGGATFGGISVSLASYDFLQA